MARRRELWGSNGAGDSERGLVDPNDRLLLGMKGTMSELELSLFPQRSHEALKQKARRGALFVSAR